MLPEWRQSSRIAGVYRATLFAWGAVLATLNFKAKFIFEAIARDGFLFALLNLFSLSAVLWFALFGLLRIAAERREPEPAGNVDWTLAALLVGVSLLPFVLLIGLVLSLAAIWLFASGAARTDSRRIALIMLAICGNLLVGPVIMTLFGPPLLAIDSMFVAWIGGTSAVGNLVSFVDGTKFTVGVSCSSVGHLSLGTLFWMTLVQLFRLPINARLICYLAATLIALFLLNTGRLAAIALNPADFNSLHNGFGASIFGWIAFVVIALVSGAGVLDVSRRAD